MKSLRILLSSIFILGSTNCGGPAAEENQRKLLEQQSGPSKGGDQQSSGSILETEESLDAEAIAEDVEDQLIAIEGEGSGEIIEEEVAAEEPAAPPVDNTPPPFLGFTNYQIKITEMKQDCSGDTVNIEQLRFKENGAFLDDTYKNHPNSPDPIYNNGKIGNYNAVVWSSGNFADFYAYEAFGGGFGSGWFSKRGTFMDNVSPTPALEDVYLRISFGTTKVKVESVYVNGGSSNLEGFEACSPSKLEILGTNNANLGWTSLAKVAVDTQEGVEIPLTLPATEIASN